MRNPFLNSAVETCIDLAFPSLTRAEGSLEPLARLSMIRILAKDTGEDLGGLLDASLLEAERAEAHRRERLVTQHAGQPGRLARRRAGRTEEREESLRLAVARIERDRRFQMPHGVVDVAQPPLDLRGQAMALHVLWARLENRLELGLGRGQLAVGYQRLGQDEPRRRVVREAREPIPAQRHRVARPPGLSIEIGELREGKGGGIPRQPLLLPADGADDRLVVPGHPRPVIRSATFRCQPCLDRHDVRDVMAARTSAGGTSKTRRNSPIWGASTKGMRPSFPFLSRLIAVTTGSTSIDGARTGSPSVFSMRSCLAVVSSSAMPSRRARRASATIPRDTASPWVYCA